MTWVEVFLVFVVCHLAGDFLFQTNSQAEHKFGGLGRNLVALRALATHVATYLLAFVPAFVWLWDSHGPKTLIAAALVVLPHLAQDDGRLLALYVRGVKGLEPSPGPLLMSIDQTLHVLVLFAASFVFAS